MPAAVKRFIVDHNLAEVRSIQGDIVRLYREDIAQYAPDSEKLAIRDIFNQMPAQLDSQSKRFTFASVSARGTYERYQNHLLWLVDAGVALPTISVSEPRHPLKLAEKRSYFKLFMNDVGLLCQMCGMEVVKGILSDKLGVNYGSIFENAVAQEMRAHGHDLHYFRNKRLGEIDFIYENGSGVVLPVEVKSGKDYKRHSALSAVMKSPNYKIDKAIVLCEANVSDVKAETKTEAIGKVTYLPIYMVMFL